MDQPEPTLSSQMAKKEVAQQDKTFREYPNQTSQEKICGPIVSLQNTTKYLKNYYHTHYLPENRREDLLIQHCEANIILILKSDKDITKKEEKAS